jgi:hypothetical protein
LPRKADTTRTSRHVRKVPRTVVNVRAEQGPKQARRQSQKTDGTENGADGHYATRLPVNRQQPASANPTKAHR